MLNQDKFLTVLNQFLGLIMRRSMENTLRYSKEKGLSMSQMGAMIHILRYKSCGVSDIGEQLGVTSAAASQMLDRLVQQQLIDRSEDPNDRRGKLLALTDKGVQVIRGGLEARQGWTSELDQVLNPEEKVQVAAALTILIEKMELLMPDLEREIEI